MTDAGIQFLNFVFNAYLSYIQFYRNNSSYDNLRKCVKNFFVGDEITAAKNLL